MQYGQRAGWLGLLLGGLGIVAATGSEGGALEDYLQVPEPHYEWKVIGREQDAGFRIDRLHLTSQEWRGHRWEHALAIVRPRRIRNPDCGFLLITGDRIGSGRIGLLKTIAERAGMAAAAVARVPNQPLYEGRKEDALIAYTFDQYLKTGDPSWPLLFPMVKSAVKAMDAMTACLKADQDLRRFVVAGASKRGWTTWLTAAVDGRVAAIAPMVIDMLNMRTQVRWADRVYGRQSEKIRDYTDLNLVARMDDPGMVQLRGWVDPYAYRQRYRMPKLILLGTNDRYWTVDALRHYWPDLPEPKLVFQTPNAGHDLNGGAAAQPTLVAFVQMIADRRPLPKLAWQFADNPHPQVTITADPPPQSLRLWSASSMDRDFRDDVWSVQREIPSRAGPVVIPLTTPEAGYRAYLVEVTMAAGNGPDYRLSTEVRVVPEGIR